MDISPSSVYYSRIALTIGVFVNGHSADYANYFGHMKDVLNRVSCLYGISFSVLAHALFKHNISL